MGELGVLRDLDVTLVQQNMGLLSAVGHLSLQQSSWDMSLLLPSEQH